jgi:2-methylisocitrate lyase-like PEP mutase family enzyme
MNIDATVLQKANQQSQRLRQLLQAPEILVMPGAYDTLSALVLESLGFPAIQGSSGAIAAVFGLQDGEVLGRERTVEVYRAMVEAVGVPVNADGEKGFGGPADVAETVRQLVAVGAAGINLEDSEHHAPGTPVVLAPIQAQVEKIDAFMETKKALDSDFFLNARVDTFLASPEPDAAALQDAIDRGNAYAEAGADCIFFIRAGDAERIRTLVKEVGAPVSILAGPTSPGVAELEELGVARVSYGLAFGNAALAGLKRLSEVLLARGDPGPLLREGFPMADLAKLLRR